MENVKKLKFDSEDLEKYGTKRINIQNTIQYNTIQYLFNTKAIGPLYNSSKYQYIE